MSLNLSSRSNHPESNTVGDREAAVTKLHIDNSTGEDLEQTVQGIHLGQAYLLDEYVTEATNPFIESQLGTGRSGHGNIDAETEVLSKPDPTIRIDELDVEDVHSRLLFKPFDETFRVSQGVWKTLAHANSGIADADQLPRHVLATAQTTEDIYSSVCCRFFMMTLKTRSIKEYLWYNVGVESDAQPRRPQVAAHFSFRPQYSAHYPRGIMWIDAHRRYEGLAEERIRPQSAAPISYRHTS